MKWGLISAFTLNNITEQSSCNLSSFKPNHHQPLSAFFSHPDSVGYKYYYLLVSEFNLLGLWIVIQKHTPLDVVEVNLENSDGLNESLSSSTFLL